MPLKAWSGVPTVSVLAHCAIAYCLLLMRIVHCGLRINNCLLILFIVISVHPPCLTALIHCQPLSSVAIHSHLVSHAFVGLNLWNLCAENYLLPFVAEFCKFWLDFVKSLRFFNIRSLEIVNIHNVEWWLYSQNVHIAPQLKRVKTQIIRTVAQKVQKCQLICFVTTL